MVSPLAKERGGGGEQEVRWFAVFWFGVLRTFQRRTSHSMLALMGGIIEFYFLHILIIKKELPLKALFLCL